MEKQDESHSSNTSHFAVPVSVLDHRSKINPKVKPRKPQSPSHQLFLSVLLFCLLIFTTSVSAKHTYDGVAITNPDFQTLKAFKQEVDPTGIFLFTWNGTRQSACSGAWTGIKCINGRVIAIQLPFKGLSGQITPKIIQLTALGRLSLHDNRIGGPIPVSIGQLTNLRGLYLFNNRLSGSIPPSISDLPNLQNLDLSGNFLNGSFPPSLANATKLYRLNLSFNSLSGSIPPEFSIRPSLTFLALQHNNLSGSIPTIGGRDNNGGFQLEVLTLDSNLLTGNIPPSLSRLTNLRLLSLSRNRITGHIPDDLGRLENLTALDLSINNLTGGIPLSLSTLPNLTSFNVSHNDLSGRVPSSLSKKFDSSSFTDNLQLCGYSNSPQCAAVSSPPLLSPPPHTVSNQHNHRRKLNTKDVLFVMIGVAILAIAFLLCVLGCCFFRKRSKPKGLKSTTDISTSTGKTVSGFAAATATGSGSGIGGGVGGGKLVLFDGPIVFTADDLLCATAEIMGKSTFGTVYKATMEDGNQVAVKRLREKLALSSKEFEVEVAALGRIRHPNLLALRAYYLGAKGEKLLVYDYLPKGSLSSYLHGRGPETLINWPTRMKIARGITRGLLHLHSNENMIHGNLTSSDIYLDDGSEPKIGDYGVSRLMTETANTNMIAAAATAGSTGYRAPEVQKTKKPTAKADIYSLGVIMLELLTGKPPGEVIDGVDLPQWVASNMKEDWSTEVFDSELGKDDMVTSRDEMLNALKLALHLVDPSPDDRPDAGQVMKQLQEINPESVVVDPAAIVGDDYKDEEKRTV